MTYSGVGGSSKYEARIVLGDSLGNITWMSPTKTLTIGADSLTG